MNRRGIGASIGGASAPFTPAGIANLALWLDSTKQAYSDTGATAPANSPDGRVRRIDQPAPLTGSWLASSDAVRPFVEDSGGVHYLDIPYNNNIAQPVGAAMNIQNCTISFAVTLRDWESSNTPVIFGSDGTQAFGVRSNAGTIQVTRQGTWTTGLVVPLSAATPQPQTTMVLTVRFSVSGANDIKLTVNGVTTTAAESHVLISRTLQGLSIGLDSSSNTAGHFAISSLVGIARAVSDTERDALHAYHLTRLAPTSFTTAAPLILVDGSSIERGFGVAPKDTWASTVPKNLWSTAPARLAVVAVSGRTIAQMAADYATRVKPFYNAARSKTILVVGGGTTNSIAQGMSGAAALTAYFAYCDQATSDGLLPIGCTVLPRSDAGASPTFETDRQTFNAGLVSGAAAHGLVIADPASVSGMGAAGDSNNLTNYQADKIHPTTVGQGLIEPAYRSAVLSLLP
jgi:hypothetical protein